MQISSKVLRVTTIEDKPFVMVNDDKPPGIEPDDPRNWMGFCIDLLMNISQETNLTFKVHVVKDKAYGSVRKMPDNTEKWNGMIGELINNEAEMALAPLTITLEREKAIDFTTPFMTLGLSILYKRPEGKKQTLFSFLQPLSPIVWGYVFATYLVVSFVLYAVARFSPYEWLNPHPCDADSTVLENQFTMLNSLWFTMGSLMQQGTEMTPKATSTRIVTGVWGLFTLIIISSYTANLAAFLTVERMVAPIDGAESLSRQTKIKYGVLSAGSSYSFFEHNSMDLYKRMFEFMKANKDVALVKTIDEGISRVSQDYAFILESTMNEFNAQRNCSLMQVGDLLDSKGYGIGFPTGSPYRDIVSEAILKMQKMQMIERCKRFWWREYQIKNPCTNQDETSKDASSLGVEQVGGVFVMLFLGMLLSIIVSFLEFIIKMKTTPGGERKPLCLAICSQVKFAIQCMSSSKRPNMHFREELAKFGSSHSGVHSREESYADSSKLHRSSQQLLMSSQDASTRPISHAGPTSSSSGVPKPPPYQNPPYLPTFHKSMLPNDALDGQLSPMFVMDPYPAGTSNSFHTDPPADNQPGWRPVEDPWNVETGGRRMQH